MVDYITYTPTGDLLHYVSDRLFNKLMVESYLNVDDQNNGDVFLNNNLRAQVLISTDNKSIFDHFRHVGN